MKHDGGKVLLPKDVKLGLVIGLGFLYMLYLVLGVYGVCWGVLFFSSRTK